MYEKEKENILVEIWKYRKVNDGRVSLYLGVRGC